MRGSVDQLARSWAVEAQNDAAMADGKAVAAQADATQALANAATADGKAVAAQGSATQALADAALRSSVVIRQATRDLSLPAGDVQYTGFGGQPKSVEIYCVIGTVNTIGSKGHDCITSKGCTSFNPATGTSSVSNTSSVSAVVNGANYQNATVKSFDADGLTLAWIKGGTPTDTASLLIIARF